MEKLHHAPSYMKYKVMRIQRVPKLVQVRIVTGII